MSAIRNKYYTIQKFCQLFWIRKRVKIKILIRFEVGNLTSPGLLVNWKEFGHVLEGMDLPPTDFHSVDDVIQQFKHLKTHFTWWFSKSCETSAKNVWIHPTATAWAHQRFEKWEILFISRLTVSLKTKLNRKSHQISAGINEFRTSRWNTYLESLSISDNTIWSATACIWKTRTKIPALTRSLPD